MTPDQVKAARKLLGWSRDRLAGLSAIPLTAVANFEHGLALRPQFAGRPAAIRAALEAAGVEFTPENDAEPGVRLKARAG